MAEIAPITVRHRSRVPILESLAALDDEAFDFLVMKVGAFAHERTGFRDKVGLAALEAAIRQYIDGQMHRLQGRG